MPLELQARIAQLVQSAQVATTSAGSSLAEAWTCLASCLDEACRAGGAVDAPTSLIRALLGISVDEVCGQFLSLSGLPTEAVDALASSGVLPW